MASARRTYQRRRRAQATGDVGAARSGAAVSGWPKTDHALFDLQPRPMVVVEVQKGRDIAGYEVFADKSKEPFVGVFKHSGQLLISTNRGIATAEFYGADMEWCWVDNLDKNAIVSCDVMHKDSGGK